MPSADIDKRKLVADLIRKVLIYGAPAREAVLCFPKDTNDKSILAAYHALVHFEADEELRSRDLLYKDEQDDYLEFISNILDRGEDLPDNIIKSYDEFYETASIPKGFWQSFLKFLNI